MTNLYHFQKQLAFNSQEGQRLIQEVKQSVETFDHGFKAIIKSISRLKDWQRIALLKFIVNYKVSLHLVPNSNHRYCFKNEHGERILGGRQIGDLATILNRYGWSADHIVLWLDQKTTNDAKNDNQPIMDHSGHNTHETHYGQLSFNFG